MVCHMQDTGTGIIFITANKVIFGTDRHIGSRDRYILITGNIHTCGIIHLIISARCNRITGNIPFAMIEYSIHIGRKHRLIGIIHSNSRIRPPEKSLWDGCRIVQFSLNFQHCTSRTQGKTCHSFLMEHPFTLAHPNNSTAVGTPFNCIVDRQERTRPVMLRPVELDTA